MHLDFFPQWPAATSRAAIFLTGGTASLVHLFRRGRSVFFPAGLARELPTFFPPFPSSIVAAPFLDGRQLLFFRGRQGPLTLFIVVIGCFTDIFFLYPRRTDPRPRACLVDERVGLAPWTRRRSRPLSPCDEERWERVSGVIRRPFLGDVRPSFFFRTIRGVEVRIADLAFSCIDGAARFPATENSSPSFFFFPTRVVTAITSPTPMKRSVIFPR